MYKVFFLIICLLASYPVFGNETETDAEITFKEEELQEKKDKINSLEKDIKKLQAQEKAIQNDKTLTTQEKERKSRKLRQLIKDKTYLKNNLQWWVGQAENVQSKLSQKKVESQQTEADFQALKDSFEKEIIALFVLNNIHDSIESIRKKILMKSLMTYQEDVIFNLNTDYLTTQSSIAQNEDKLTNINEKIESKQKQQEEVNVEFTDYLRQTEELESKIANLNSQETSVLNQRKKLISDKERLEKEAEDLEKFIEEMIRLKAETDATKMVNNILIKRPCQGNIVKDFGVKLNQLSKVTNKGIEINVPPGSPIEAVFSGEVIYSGYVKSKGQLIIVDHLNGFVSVYANNSSLERKKGDLVNQGQLLGYSGTNSEGRPLVYFELRKNNVPVNPKVYFIN